jgi:thiamine-phosphate pyrophosphorylase
LQAARLYLVTPAAPAAGALEDFLPRVLEAGVDAVQLREKHMEARQLLRVAEVVRRRTLEFGALFVVNDRVDLALAAGADGVHLGQDDLSPAHARRQATSGMLIGLSTHAPAEVTAAWGSGVDYIGVGPVHATPTKPGRPPVGLDLVRFAATGSTPPDTTRWTDDLPASHDEAGASRAGAAGCCPFFAIGGIDASTLPAVLAAGATRVCVLRALTESADPAGAARELRALLEAALADGPPPVVRAARSGS